MNKLKNTILTLGLGAATLFGAYTLKAQEPSLEQRLSTPAQAVEVAKKNPYNPQDFFRAMNGQNAQAANDNWEAKMQKMESDFQYSERVPNSSSLTNSYLENKGIDPNQISYLTLLTSDPMNKDAIAYVLPYNNDGQHTFANKQTTVGELETALNGVDWKINKISYSLPETEGVCTYTDDDGIVPLTDMKASNFIPEDDVNVAIQYVVPAGADYSFGVLRSRDTCEETGDSWLNEEAGTTTYISPVPVYFGTTTPTDTFRMFDVVLQ